jgi:hypothetical protein
MVEKDNSIVLQELAESMDMSSVKSERNQFMEMDGLYWESETHEWFHDKTHTQVAHKNSVSSSGEYQNDELNNIYCFVVRNKETGEYDRVMMDKNEDAVIYDTKYFSAMSSQIDMMKVARRWEVLDFAEVEDESLREKLITEWKKTGLSSKQILHKHRGNIAGTKFGF